MPRCGHLALGTVLALVPLQAAGARQPWLEFTHLYMMDSGDLGEGERVAKPGDRLFTTGLRFETTARILAPTVLRVHGLSMPVGDRLLLIQAFLDRRDYYALSDAALVFCSGSFALSPQDRFAEETVGGRTRRIERFESEVAFCLIDDDASGNFDRAFVNGASADNHRGALPIGAIAYSLEKLAAPVEAQVAVEFVHGGTLNTPMLEVTTNILDGEWMSGELQFWQSNGNSDDFDTRRRVSDRTYPYSLRYQNAVVTILGFDESSSTIRYRLDGEIEQSRIRIGVTDPNNPNLYLLFE